MIYTTPPPDFSPQMHVVSCFCEYDGKILLLHRQDHKPHGNTWGVPAGKMDHGESLTAAMVRELEEEVRIRVTEDSLHLLQTVYVTFPEYNIVYYMFRRSFDELPQVDVNLEEHKTHVWVTPEESLNMNLIHDEDACIKLIYGV